ncbi:MAG TPA: response regulator, partial [Desulfosarcina sp.]|nr:response regulator [Desulfosarcina sp.]
MKGRILVVDDERDMLLLLERIISEETGHKVVTTHDPLEALAQVQSGGFDLVITDLKMPRMDGISLLDKIRALDAT